MSGFKDGVQVIVPAPLEMTGFHVRDFKQVRLSLSLPIHNGLIDFWLAYVGSKKSLAFLRYIPTEYLGNPSSSTYIINRGIQSSCMKLHESSSARVPSAFITFSRSHQVVILLSGILIFVLSFL